MVCNECNKSTAGVCVEHSSVMFKATQSFFTDAPESEARGEGVVCICNGQHEKCAIIAAKDQEIAALKSRAEAAEARAEKEKASCLELYRQREEALRERDDSERLLSEWREACLKAQRERDKLRQDLHLAVSNAGKDLIRERDEARAEAARLREAVEPLVEAVEKLVATCDCEVYEACSCAYNAEQQGIAALAAYRAAHESAMRKVREDVKAARA